MTTKSATLLLALAVLVAPSRSGSAQESRKATETRPGPAVREWTLDGAVRRALVSLPARPPEGGSPVILAFHGHGGTMRNMARHRFEDLWPAAIVVCPQGLPTATARDPEGRRSGWQPRLGVEGDRDLRFVDAILATLIEGHGADPSRIYATGHSNGGGFTYLLAAARNDVFAAVAPSAAAAASLRGATGLRPIPVLHVAGRNDEIVPFDFQKRTMTAMRRLNGCSADGRPWATSGRLTGTIYASETGSPFVEVIHAGTHLYPAEAPGLIVRFFREHRRPAPPAPAESR